LGAGSLDASGEVFTGATRADPENAPFNVVVQHSCRSSPVDAPVVAAHPLAKMPPVAEESANIQSVAIPLANVPSLMKLPRVRDETR
jgi:hypothetical protein